MSGAVPAADRSPDDTADALAGSADYVCVDCDLHQVEAMLSCPACGGVVVARLDMEQADYDPLIGRKIGGRFVVVARLGAGSMGSVYRARQTGMSREVALKVLKPERAFDAASQQRFEREARATSALTSPHTVTVYDFGEDDSLPGGPVLYLAMERLEGESLGQRLKRIGRIAPLEATKIAQQVLRSLSEAHDKGVVHRDLKPDNIFLHKVPTPHGTEEVVKVLDFGIAKILQPDLKVDSLETQAGTVFGTPRYMSPEQAQSKPLDGRSDLYTVGLILFQMVTGRHVFPDEDAVVVMARHIQSLPPRPREVAPDAHISKRLEAIILRALAKDPRRRPQTALELHEELEASLHEREQPSIPPPAHSTQEGMDVSTGAPTLQAPARQTRRIAAAAIMGFAIIVLGVGIGVGLAKRGGPVAAGVTAEASEYKGPTVTETPRAKSNDDDSTARPTAAATASASTSATPSAAPSAAAAVRPAGRNVGSAPTTASAKPTAKIEATAEAPTDPTPAPTPAPTTKKKKSGYDKFD